MGDGKQGSMLLDSRLNPILLGPAWHRVYYLRYHILVVLDRRILFCN